MNGLAGAVFQVPFSEFASLPPAADLEVQIAPGRVTRRNEYIPRILQRRDGICVVAVHPFVRIMNENCHASAGYFYPVLPLRARPSIIKVRGGKSEWAFRRRT